MKIFVFSTHTYWPNHRETELELIQNHLDKGHQVIRFYCNSHLPVCDVNLEHSLIRCLECRDRRITGGKLLNGKVIELPLISLPENNEYERLAIPEYSSVEELEKVHVKNFDVGYAVMCSVGTLLREPNPNLVVHRKLIDDFLHSAIQLFYSTIEYIKKYSPDLVYVFNGRFAHVKAIWRASQHAGINCVIHERGYNKHHYELYNNTTPHDKDYVLACMLDAWNKADPEERIKKADAFYKNRLGGKEQGWYSFITKQEKGLLPLNWNPELRNIIIFHTSEDEFANVGPEWKNYLYKTQIEGISKILEDTKKFKDMHFYLRVHPNLAGLNNSEVQALGKLKFDNLTVINAQSTISSYDLLFNCEKIISFGSTVGIEAVYWRKPSIQLGHAYYNDLSATYRPFTHSEVIKMIISQLLPMDKEPSLIYGYYFNTYGIPFKFYKPSGLFDGSYLGENISKHSSFLTRLYNMLNGKKFVHRLVKYLENDFRRRKRILRVPDWLH